MAKVKIIIKSKEGVLDPQGKTVKSALVSLGFKEVSDVKIGKYIEIELKNEKNAHKRVTEMCQKLLANPNIEQFQITEIEK